MKCTVCMLSRKSVCRL